MIDSFGSTIVGTRAALVALDVALKATVLMALAFACHAALGRQRALIRSALWNACLVGLLLLPAASLAFPRLRIVLPAARTAQLEPTTLVRDVPPPSNVAAEPDSSLDPVPLDAPAMRPFGPVAVAWPRPDHGAIEPATRLGGAGIAFGLYLIVAALLGMRLAAALLAVGRLRRCGRPIEDPRWAEALDRWRTRLGVTRRIPLLATGRVSVPIAVGWLRPAIILPESLVDATTPGLIDAVLLHELGHIRRGDFAWNIVRKLVQVVYWPHPLAWLVGRIVGAVREQACDDLCVHGLGGSDAYRASLLEVASGLIRRPEPALGLAMARSPKLGRRLAWIDRTRGASHCLLRWPARLALAVAVVAAAGVIGSVELARATAKAVNQTAKPAERPQSDPAPPAPLAIEVAVRAKDTGKPIEGATVRATINMEERVQKTDRDGQVRIILFRHGSLDSVNIDVWAEGYVQQRHYFAQNNTLYPKIPAQAIIELLPGEQTLGGTVVDEQGRPIKGVKVVIWGYPGEKKRKEELCYMVDATTDERGHWRCRCFRNMQFIYLYLSHPDHLADGERHPRMHGQPTPTDSPQKGEMPMEGLRDFSDVQVMTRGVEIAGEVRGEQGNPIQDAEVGWLEEDQHDTFHEEMPTTTTDASGRFRFPHVRRGRLVLQVKAKGHAPDLKSVVAKEGVGPVAIRLGPAHTLMGRVVDSQGHPIAGAFLGVAYWRTYRARSIPRVRRRRAVSLGGRPAGPGRDLRQPCRIRRHLTAARLPGRRDHHHFQAVDVDLGQGPRHQDGQADQRGGDRSRGYGSEDGRGSVESEPVGIRLPGRPHRHDRHREDAGIPAPNPCQGLRAVRVADVPRQRGAGGIQRRPGEG